MFFYVAFAVMAVMAVKREKELSYGYTCLV